MDVSGAVTEIAAAGTAAGTVGVAVLAALGVIFGFRLVRKALG